MLKKFLHGFLFGIGFSVAIAIAAWVAVSINISSFERHSEYLSSSPQHAASYKEKAEWRKLSLTEKIDAISGVVLLRFKDEPDGLMAAYVERVATRDSAITLPHSVGDRVKSSDYYAQEAPYSNRDGVLLMYSGEPPKEMEGKYLYESRLSAHGDMPVELFFTKVEEAWGH